VSYNRGATAADFLGFGDFLPVLTCELSRTITVDVARFGEEHCAGEGERHPDADNQSPAEAR
jgi:hypothetical protein